MTATHRAFTLIEMIVGGAVFFLLITIAYTFFTGAFGGTNRSIEASDALRSTLIATEVLRHDAARLFFQEDQDLVILKNGRGLSMLVPEATDDLWSVPGKPVTYLLDPLPGVKEVYRLIRQDARGPRPIAGCLLKDLLVRYVPAGEISELQGYLEVTMIGLGSASSKATYTGSALLPLNRTRVPALYPLPAVAK